MSNTAAAATTEAKNDVVSAEGGAPDALHKIPGSAPNDVPVVVESKVEEITENLSNLKKEEEQDILISSTLSLKDDNNNHGLEDEFEEIDFNNSVTEESVTPKKSQNRNFNFIIKFKTISLYLY